ncbi:hypothetical protein J6590_025906 [Homalodisca vitripennis]|nr:hypothetical protein J6590_025906 [Homalodisca vitripennis]
MQIKCVFHLEPVEVEAMRGSFSVQCTAARIMPVTPPAQGDVTTPTHRVPPLWVHRACRLHEQLHHPLEYHGHNAFSQTKDV